MAAGGPAIGAGANRCPDFLDTGEALVADRRQDRLHADIEADAKDRPAVGLSHRGPAGEEGDGRRSRISLQFAGNPVAWRKHAVAAGEQGRDQPLLLIEYDDARVAAAGIDRFGPGTAGSSSSTSSTSPGPALIEPAAGRGARPPEAGGANFVAST